ncbi:hypothetical protein D9756_000456 [Leucocoprinus leucothites]|uniref:Uncharacterized protein n=1 Tax=Leucocoprinus leucothites TaxID=201217 RepID=A0A8H5GFH0_9AGAR|nr:hypothetical protein D9756_000456 [Leucoagaricus leucothites]
MRRLTAVFSKRDKSDSHHHSDHSHQSSQPFKKHLKLPLSIGFSSSQLRTPSSIASTPQLSSVSDHAQSSGSSSGSASLSFPTPEDDSQAPSLARSNTRRSWKDWLGGKRSEPEPPPISDLPKPPGWNRQASAWDERPPTLQGPRARHRVQKEADVTEDESSEEYDDEESVSISDHPRSPINKPGFVASPERARLNLEILIKNGVNPPLPATPFVQHSADYLFPRSCNRPRPLPVFDTRRVMFKRRLLNRLDQLSADEEQTILPFASKNAPVTMSAPVLPSYETIRPSKSTRVFAASPGVRRWISRPCFEDRFSIFLPSQEGVRVTPVVGTLAVTAIEYSEFLDVMVDPDFDPSLPPPEQSQDVQWSPPLQVTMPSQSPLLGTSGSTAPSLPSAIPRPSYLPSPSPLRNQHKSDVSLSDSTSQSTILAPASTITPSLSSQNSKMNLRPDTLPPPQTSIAAPVKRVVRFVEDDTEDKVPLHLVRQKKKQEEKAKFLRAEQRKRLMEQEQERRRLEAEALVQERKRLLKEKERKELEQRQYAELVASARLRRETQRAGIIPGLKVDSNGSLLAPSPSTTSLRESERNRPRESRGSSLMPHHTGSSTSIPRRDASDSALHPSHFYSFENSSYRAGSGGHSPGGSASGHGHQSRPGSMYSSSSEDGWLNSKRHSGMSNSFTRPLPDRMSSYPTWSGSNHSLHNSPSVSIPPVPSFPLMPELMNDFVLLPPSAPFMMHQHGRQSRNSSPGRSTSSGSLRGGSPNSSSERINPSRQSLVRPKDLALPSPSTSLSHVDSQPMHTRSGSTDSRRASMPVPVSNRSSAPRSQSNSLSRGRPILPHAQTVQGIQHVQSSSPWTALPTQWGTLPTAMPMSPYTHSTGANTPSKKSSPNGSKRGKVV